MTKDERSFPQRLEDAIDALVERHGGTSKKQNLDARQYMVVEGHPSTKPALSPSERPPQPADRLSDVLHGQELADYGKVIGVVAAAANAIEEGRERGISPLTVIAEVRDSAKTRGESARPVVDLMDGAYDLLLEGGEDTEVSGLQRIINSRSTEPGLEMG